MTLTNAELADRIKSYTTWDRTGEIYTALVELRQWRELGRELLQVHQPTGSGRLCVYCGAADGDYPCVTAQEVRTLLGDEG